MNNISVGRIGECAACDYLNDKNYLILDRNWRYSKHGEIDIIALNDGNQKYIVFIEVKTRTSTYFGAPSESVGSVKQSRIRKLASIYLMYKKYDVINVRFDVIEVILSSDNTTSINHIENAF